MIGRDSKLLKTILVLYQLIYLGNISSLISSTNTQIGLYFTGDDWLTNQMIMMKSKNYVIYEENKDSQLISPNPFKT